MLITLLLLLTLYFVNLLSSSDYVADDNDEYTGKLQLSQ